MAPTPEPGFDQVLVRLRGLVEQLEGGQLTLEQSLAAFEEGVGLSRQGAQILDSAEHRVELLLNERDENGVERTAPFTPGSGPGPGASAVGKDEPR